MIGKTFFIASAMMVLFMSARSSYPLPYYALVYHESSWGEILKARKKNQRAKAQKYRRRK